MPSYRIIPMNLTQAHGQRHTLSIQVPRVKIHHQNRRQVELLVHRMVDRIGGVKILTSTTSPHVIGLSKSVHLTGLSSVRGHRQSQRDIEHVKSVIHDALLVHFIREGRN